MTTETETKRNIKQQHIHQARLLARSQHTGVLSTHSKALGGYPFGSVTPFMMTDNGNIIIYASDIAQHSRNMKENCRVSLCVYDAKQDDSQASARITFIADASWENVSELEQQRYFELFPQARAYVEAHDFRFYLLDVNKIRYIGGFGEIYWFSIEEWSQGLASVAESQRGIIEHMHEDHLDALQMIAQNRMPSTVIESVSMLSVFPEGFHVEVTVKGDKQCSFIPFKRAIGDDYPPRMAMVDLTKEARQM